MSYGPPYRIAQKLELDSTRETLDQNLQRIEVYFGSKGMMFQWSFAEWETFSLDVVGNVILINTLQR